MHGRLIVLLTLLNRSLRQLALRKRRPLSGCGRNAVRVCFQNGSLRPPMEAALRIHYRVAGSSR